MIKLKGIYTIRDTRHPYYWDVVFEWEDELSRALDIPLIRVGEKYDKLYRSSISTRILNRLNFYQWKDRFLFNPSGYYIAFHIGPPGIYSFHSRKDVIPIIIDFWKSENLKKFESIFSLNKFVFVTSKEVFNYLTSQKLKINLAHLALSLPDKLMADYSNQQRPFDLIQLGRQNEKLTAFTTRLLVDFPDINYVHGQTIDGKLQMISSRHGTLGEFSSRESFITLLKKARISLLSAPGLDADSKRTGGFSPVTPRFLESAACGCKLIGIYPENDDFVHYGINNICANVKTYEEFQSLVLNYLKDPTIPDYREFLLTHLTTQRATQLLAAIS
ncbi:MAG: glycosyltransferase [Cyclobacteriaceae bacterium]|nr:glycosyltransferase [Cyclobacteriaceae bacterium]MDH4298594.1 glycosyltransferase [Cyclobacteriaceae bacterium]MDH5248135.1 glycosyltransferase [Cyclobacteriaceae bacterium]